MDGNKDRIPDVLERLVASYSRDGGANGLGGRMIPSRQSIVGILKTLQSIMFPGFYEEEHITEANIRALTGERLFSVSQHLAAEIEKGLCHYCDDEGPCKRHGQCIDQAQVITGELIELLPAIRERLRGDVDAIFQGDPAAKSPSEVILAYPGLAAISAFRLAHELFVRDVPMIPRMMMEHIHHETGIDIHPGATIGDRLFIDHGTGIVVGETAVIGNRVMMYHGVTLGAFAVSKEMAGKKRHPTIEDDVTIYAGATILGGETVVGAGSVVGANVWVTRSVPPGTKVKN